MTEDDVLPISEVDRIWPAYIEALRARTESAQHFAVTDHDELQRWLTQIALGVGADSAVWLAFIESEPIGIEAPAAPLLQAGPTYLVSSAADLMLTSRSVTDGIAVELNHLPVGDEFEVVAWGKFASAA